MKHSLGSLQCHPAPDFPALFRRMRAMFRRMDAGRPGAPPMPAFRMARQSDQRPYPDLLSVLDVHDPDRAWVEAVAATVDEMQAEGRRFTLVDCERTTDCDAYCGVTLYEPALARSVQENDVVSAGVAIIRRAHGEPEVMPRIFRKVCSNGAVVDLGAGTAQAVEAYEVARAMRDCLTPTGLDLARTRFERAANTLIPDVEVVLARARPRTPTGDIVALWREAGDRSAWGLVNAATALAHDEPNLARRLERERDAERILVAALAGHPVAPRAPKVSAKACAPTV